MMGTMSARYLWMVALGGAAALLCAGLAYAVMLAVFGRPS